MKDGRGKLSDSGTSREVFKGGPNTAERPGRTRAETDLCIQQCGLSSPTLISPVHPINNTIKHLLCIRYFLSLGG